jgi:hypothetical protein
MKPLLASSRAAGTRTHRQRSSALDGMEKHYRILQSFQRSESKPTPAAASSPKCSGRDQNSPKPHAEEKQAFACFYFAIMSAVWGVFWLYKRAGSEYFRPCSASPSRPVQAGHQCFSLGKGEMGCTWSDEQQEAFSTLEPEKVRRAECPRYCIHMPRSPRSRKPFATALRMQIVLVSV